MRWMLDKSKGLMLLAWLNWDLVFTLGTVIAGLLAGAYLGQAINSFQRIP